MPCKICIQLEEAVAASARPDSPNILLGLKDAGLRNRARQKEERQHKASVDLEKHQRACHKFGERSSATIASPEPLNMNYTVISQNVNEVRDTQNAPAFSMAQFLVERDQMALLPTISIYAQRGNDFSNARMLYMNATALRVWKEMGMQPTEIGTQHRPARTAVLAYGVPFSE